MSSERHARISALFLEARALDFDERAAFLVGLEPELRAEVESLLAHDRPDEEPASSGELAPLPADAEQGSRWDAGLEGEVSKLLQAARDLDPLGAGLEGKADEPGPTIGDYRILRRLGAGGMAIVYEAEQISLKRKVALKILPSHLRFAKDAVGKFQREAEAGGRQSHPGIVAIHALGEHEGIHYIAQELVPGGRTLAHELTRLREQQELSSAHFRWAAELAAKVADALGHAHASGVVHRDVKPSNILLSAEGEPKVADFGLAKVEDALALSRTGDLLGTPFYMSPEQAQNPKGGVDHRTDVYSLGVTLYELVTLQRPFDGESSQAILEKIVHEDARPPRSAGSQVPADLSTICLAAMEKEPARRYQSMSAFAADLRRFVAGEPIRARPSGPLLRAARWMRRNAVASVAAIAGIVAVTAVVILTLDLSRNGERSATPEYATLMQALDLRDWVSLTPHLTPQRSPFYTVDTGDPCYYMLRALMQIGKPTEETALADLERCVEACEVRGERELARDARYLDAVVSARLARDPDCGPERSAELLRRLEARLEEAGEPERVSPEALLRRQPVERLHLEPVELNLEHPFVHLCRASVSFGWLYKGGLPMDYERTIEDLRIVLDRRPGNLIARTLLGRTLFFYARSHDRLDLLDEAEQHLRAALADAEESGAHLVHTTLGQLLLLRGDHRSAREVLERAEELSVHAPEHAHNIHRALASVAAREGRPAEALERLSRALEITRGDAKVKVAIAELHLSLGNTQEALHWAQEALLVNHPLSDAAPTDIAPAYLLFARVCLATDDWRGAYRSLCSVYRDAVPSPRDLSLAAQLALTFPEEAGYDFTTVFSELSILAGIDSPLCHSALGVLQAHSGELRTAIGSFERAIEKRAEWPQDIREHRWADTARDLYLLAMTRYELDQQAGDWRESYQRAEREVAARGVPFEYPDILARVRAKAKRVLPVGE
jgi:tetratricopeptide (TPR) repeat protein